MSFADELRSKSRESDLYWKAMTGIANYVYIELKERCSMAAEICRNEVVVRGGDIFNFNGSYMSFLEWLKEKGDDGERIANAIESILENNSMSEKEIEILERYLSKEFQGDGIEFSIDRIESHSPGYYWMEFVLNW